MKKKYVFESANARSCFLFLIVFSFVFSRSLFAVTAANTLIQNRASISYQVASETFTALSNIDSFRVDELIDLTLTADNASGVQSQNGQTNAVLTFTLTNLGNGSEAFSFVTNQLIVDQFDAQNLRIYIDANSNGTFDLATDTLYIPSSNEPVLAASTSKQIFIVADMPTGLPSGDISQIQLVATSVTGTGTVGSALPGAGTGGVNAVFGSQEGTMSATNSFIIASASGTLTKSATYLDPTGGNEPLHDAVITYTLTLNVTGLGNLTSVNISDLIPANTTYELGSIKLDGLPLTDAADLDAGVFNGTGISVSLGTVPAPTTRTVTFKVRIQ